jgi:hypothetical protein
MSYTYLQEREEASLVGCFADIPPYVLSRLNLTAEKSYFKDNETEYCQSSQSGTMSAPLMEHLGEGKLISSAVDSLAKTSHVLEKVQALKESEAVCGNTWLESSVKFDLTTHSWKTHQCLWDEDLAPSSLTLPKWGMMQSGALWERITPPPLTSGTESGFLLPTPAARDYKGANSREHCETNGTGRKHMDQLANAVAYPDLLGNRANAAMIGGATSTECTLENAPALKSTNGTVIHTQFATPQARDFRTGQQSRWDNQERSRNLNDQIGGQLNPTWVEWLMGWPLKWTDLKPLGTDKFVLWLNSHGKFSQNNK